jgi:hypothetical protein
VDDAVPIGQAIGVGASGHTCCPDASGQDYAGEKRGFLEEHEPLKSKRRARGRRAAERPPVVGGL